MIKHDDGTIEYEVGDAVYDSDGDGGHIVGVNDDEGIVWIEPYCDKGSAYRWGLDAITPANPPAEPPKRTVKQEWEYAMECAGIAAKHTTPDDLAERVFVA